MTAQIRAAFRDYFAPFDPLELPDPIPHRGTIDQGRTGWQITYLLNQDDQGKPCLDLLAQHPEIAMIYLRIDAEGNHQLLESYQDHYSFDPQIPGDEARAYQSFLDHNHQVDAILKAKGF